MDLFYPICLCIFVTRNFGKAPAKRQVLFSVHFYLQNPEKSPRCCGNDADTREKHHTVFMVLVNFNCFRSIFVFKSKASLSKFFII